MGSDESIAIIQPNLDTTIPNCWDIILQNEDYTLGTILNDKLYRNFCHRDMEHPTQVDTNLLDYCGFKKEHPHDKSSVIRIGFGKSEHNQIEIVQSLFSQIIPQIIVEFVQIRQLISS